MMSSHLGSNLAQFYRTRPVAFRFSLWLICVLITLLAIVIFGFDRLSTSIAGKALLAITFFGWFFSFQRWLDRFFAKDLARAKAKNRNPRVTGSSLNIASWLLALTVAALTFGGYGEFSVTTLTAKFGGGIEAAMIAWTAAVWTAIGWVPLLMSIAKAFSTTGSPTRDSAK